LPLGKKVLILLERERQIGIFPTKLFTAINSSSVRKVTDIYRLVAYHNTHSQRAIWWFWHRWPWTTLNPEK